MLKKDRHSLKMHDLRKRIVFVAQHRGTKEADIMIGRFVEEVLPQLSDAELSELESFLQIADATLIDWAFKRKTPEGAEKTAMVERFLEFYK